MLVSRAIFGGYSRGPARRYRRLPDLRDLFHPRFEHGDVLVFLRRQFLAKLFSRPSGSPAANLRK
jgi:hypothetical protein